MGFKATIFIIFVIILIIVIIYLFNKDKIPKKEEMWEGKEEKVKEQPCTKPEETEKIEAVIPTDDKDDPLLENNFDPNEFGPEEIIYQKNNVEYARRKIVKPSKFSHIFYEKYILKNESSKVKLKKLTDMDIPKLLKESLAKDYVNDQGFKDYKFIHASLMPTDIDDRKSVDTVYKYTADEPCNEDKQVLLLTFTDAYLLREINDVINNTVENGKEVMYEIAPYIQTYVREGMRYHQFVIYDIPKNAVRFERIYNHKNRDKKVKVNKMGVEAKVHYGKTTLESYVTQGLIEMKHYLRFAKFSDPIIDNTVTDILSKFVGEDKVRKVDNHYLILDIQGKDWNDLVALMNVLSTYRNVFQISIHSIFV